MRPGDHDRWTLPNGFLLVAKVNLLQAGRRLRGAFAQSTFYSFIILCVIAGYCCLSFFLFYKALQFVGAFPGLGALLTERMVFHLRFSLRCF